METCSIEILYIPGTFNSLQVTACKYKVTHWISYLLSGKNECLLLVLDTWVPPSSLPLSPSCFLKQVINVTNWRSQLLLLKVSPVLRLVLGSGISSQAMWGRKSNKQYIQRVSKLASIWEIRLADLESFNCFWMALVSPKWSDRSFLPEKWFRETSFCIEDVVPAQGPVEE